jgi:hypothetical protein
VNVRAPSICALCLLTVLPVWASPAATHRFLATDSFSIRHKSSKKQKSVVHTTPAMDPGRARQIQAALIKAGYLSGEPTGTWDASSNAAMQKYQGANGWQTKLTPDSRALIKLGLGSPASQTN